MSCSIKRPGLNFPQKSLLNDLVYLKIWEPQYMKIKEINFLFEKFSIIRPKLFQFLVVNNLLLILYQFQILEAFNDQVL